MLCLKEAGLSAWGSPCNESHCWELFRQTPETASALGAIPLPTAGQVGLGAASAGKGGAGGSSGLCFELVGSASFRGQGYFRETFPGRPALMWPVQPRSRQSRNRHVSGPRGALGRHRHRRGLGFQELAPHRPFVPDAPQPFVTSRLPASQGGSSHPVHSS